jgi:hypothetical protein
MACVASSQTPGGNPLSVDALEILGDGILASPDDWSEPCPDAAG